MLKKVLLSLTVITLILLSPVYAVSGGKSIMIIPFDPDMYFSDSDQELARYNQVSIPEVRAMFRYGLNTNLNAHILAAYETRPLLSDTIEDALDDLNAIYRSLRYRKEKPMGSMFAQQEKEEDIALVQEERRGGLGRILNRNNGDRDAQRANRYEERERENRRYMNVVVNNTEMFRYLSGKYGTDLFLFVNQFELATNYEKCLDRATNNFERTVKVHYSLFDRNGEQIAGDVVKVNFGSNTNDIMKIMRTQFPPISQKLFSSLPPEGRIEPTGTPGEMRYKKFD